MYLDIYCRNPPSAGCTCKAHTHTALKQQSLTQVYKQNSYITLSAKETPDDVVALYLQDAQIWSMNSNGI